MDHLHFASNGDRSSYDTQITNSLSRPSPKSVYEKFLISHSENKVPNDNYDNSSEATTGKRRYTTIEARIEQELEELRKREDELR